MKTSKFQIVWFIPGHPDEVHHRSARTYMLKRDAEDAASEQWDRYANSERGELSYRIEDVGSSRDMNRDASTNAWKVGATKAWTVWGRGTWPGDEPLFIAAFSDKGEAQRRIARLRRSNGLPASAYFLKHGPVPVRQQFDRRESRRGRHAEARHRARSSHDVPRSKAKKSRARSTRR